METRHWFALLHHDETYDPKHRIQLLSEEAATRCLRHGEGHDLSSEVSLKTRGTTYATLVPLALTWSQHSADEIAEACASLGDVCWFKPFDYAQYMEATTPAVVQEITTTYAAEGHQVAIRPGLVAVEYPGYEPYVFFSEDFRSHGEGT